MNPIPFLSKEDFEKTKPDKLFPIHDYEICKKVWETSPLIIALCEEVIKMDNPSNQ